MQPIKINGKDTGYYFLSVEKDADNIYIPNCVNNQIWYFIGQKTFEIEIPAGKYQIIGCITHDTVDEGCKVMAKEHRYLDLYYNYADNAEGARLLDHWQESVRSLLLHNGIEIKENQKLLIVKKVI